MTGSTVPPAEPVAEVGIAEIRALRNARLRGVVFAALWVATSSFSVEANFSFWIREQSGDAARVSTTAGVFWLIAGIATGAVGIYQLAAGARVPWRRLLGVLIPLWTAAAVASLLGGRPANLTGIFAQSLELATPIALGAFAGILSERSGMLNIAIEGKILIGACIASIVSSVAHLALAGALAALITGIFVGLLLAWLGIRWKVDQIIAGTVINIGAIGLTNFVFLRILGKNTWLNTPATIERIRIPVLSDIPILGPILFDGTPFLYLTLGLMLFLTYMIYRTRWGLRLRAAGEKPEAAGTVGIDVLKIRYRSMIMAGALAGLAGSYLSLASAGSFQMQMSSGRGYIALAAMIFGAWHPIYAFGAALVFGFADATQSLMSVLGVDVPPQILASVPYLATVIVVAGLVGRVRGPAMAGQAYEQG
jgi:ABC-type uncharacterized transport system permease subunit